MSNPTTTVEPTVDRDEVDRRTWDVTVVGAGPAGSVAARQLALRGLAVLLVDRASFPRNKVCGGTLNRASLAMLGQLGLQAMPTQLGARRFDRMLLAAGGRRAMLPLPAGFSVSRAAFDVALVREAIAAGAAFLPRASARLVGEQGDCRRLALQCDGGNRRVATRIVVDASGLKSPLRSRQPAYRETVARKPRIGLGALVENGPTAYETGAIHMAAGEDGYVGAVRVEDGRLEVAAAVDPAFVRESGGAGPAIVAILKRAGLPVIDRIAVADWRGTPALSRRPDTVAEHRLFAVGDAAGYVEPFTGEGMAWALNGAAALSPIAFEAAGQWSAEHAARWERTYRRLIGRRQFLCRGVKMVLRRPWLSSTLVRTLAAVPALARPATTAINRPALQRV